MISLRNNLIIFCLAAILLLSLYQATQYSRLNKALIQHQAQEQQRINELESQLQFLSNEKINPVKIEKISTNGYGFHWISNIP